MRAAKAILYPFAGLFQFWLAYKHGFPSALIFIVVGILLIVLGFLNLQRGLENKYAGEQHDDK